MTGEEDPFESRIREALSRAASGAAPGPSGADLQRSLHRRALRRTVLATVAVLFVVALVGVLIRAGDHLRGEPGTSPARPMASWGCDPIPRDVPRVGLDGMMVKCFHRVGVSALEVETGPDGSLSVAMLGSVPPDTESVVADLSAWLHHYDRAHVGFRDGRVSYSLMVRGQSSEDTDRSALATDEEEVP